MAPDQPDTPQRREQALLEFAARGINLRRRGRLDAIAVSAIDALRREEIDAFLLKGAALAELLYAPNLERGYFDIDLMVAPFAVPAARQVLAGLGYASVNSDRGIADVGEALHAEAWSRLDPEIGNVMIDLHWRLVGCLAAPEMAWDILRSGAQSVTIAGREVQTLGRPALALHAALHLAQHGPEDPKAAADLALAAERWDQEVWRAAARLADQLDATDAFAAGLRLLPESARIADMLGLFPSGRTVWEMAHRGLRPRGTFYLSALAQAPTLRGRAAVVRRALLPSPAWIRWEMSWASRGPGHLTAAYALHLLRAPIWAARAFRFARSRPRRQI